MLVDIRMSMNTLRTEGQGHQPPMHLPLSHLTPWTRVPTLRCLLLCRELCLMVSLDIPLPFCIPHFSFPQKTCYENYRCQSPAIQLYIFLGYDSLSLFVSTYIFHIMQGAIHQAYGNTSLCFSDNLACILQTPSQLTKLSMHWALGNSRYALCPITIN